MFKNWSKKQQAYGWMIVNTVLWGAAFVLSKPAFETTTPFRFLLYRFFIAAVLAAPLLWKYRHSRWSDARTVLKITGLELIGSTVTLIFLWGGLSLTTALEAGLLATTAPLFVVLLGIWWLKERQELPEWWGLGFAVVGTLLIALLPLTTETGLVLTGALVGNASILIANITESVYFVLAKKQYAKLPKLFVTSISFYVGLISFAILSWFEAGWQLQVLLGHIAEDLSDPQVVFAACYMAIFGSIIGLTAYIKGQDGIEASEASLFRYLQPLVYIPLAVLLLGERLYSVQLLALFLIIIGFLLSEQRSNSVWKGWFGHRRLSREKDIVKTTP